VTRNFDPNGEAALVQSQSLTCI